jgi:hypothetical protein
MLVQRVVPNEIAWLAVSMFQKSSCDKFLGEILSVRARTLGDAACLATGVTTLGSNGELRY